MSARRTLALMLSPRLDAGVEEFVRLCVGLVAGGGTVEIVEAGAGAGVLTSAAALPAELERSLEVLAEVGVVPRVVTGDDLLSLLEACDDLLRVADPDRRGQPELLFLDSTSLYEAGGMSARSFLAELASAGQVVLTL